LPHGSRVGRTDPQLQQPQAALPVELVGGVLAQDLLHHERCREITDERRKVAGQPGGARPVEVELRGDDVVRQKKQVHRLVQGGAAGQRDIRELARHLCLRERVAAEPRQPEPLRRGFRVNPSAQILAVILRQVPPALVARSERALHS